MLPRSELNQILTDEGLTRHLGDAEARVLVEWLVDQAEAMGDDLPPDAVAPRVRSLCRRGRAISRFVQLWALDCRPGAALQLAASERFDWPLPDGPIDPDVLMYHIVVWETNRLIDQANRI
ncbi:MAG: hypothetical protein U0736_21710 [Gemmataceae bacterium]